MSASRPRVVLVSVGWYGQKYLNEFTQKDLGADLAGIVDVAEDLEEKYPVIRERHIPVYHSLEDFYREDHADLSILVSPIHLHTQMALYCLEKGSHVLCEKPLCLTEEETRNLEAAGQAAGKILAVGWQLNYDPGVLRLKQDILSGRFGAPLRLRCMHAMRRGAAYYKRSNWAGKITLGGHEVLDSPFMNACAHNFQLMTYLLGSSAATAALPAEAEGELFHANPDAENYDIACLRFRTQEGVQLFYETAHPLRTKNLGQEGLGEFEHARLTWGKGKSLRVTLDTGEELDYGDPEKGNPMEKLAVVLRCMETGEKVPCTPVSGLGHLLAVRMAQALPVQEVAEERKTFFEEAGDRFLAVEGLEDTFRACLQGFQLPSEIGRSFS
ncbi:MAG: Gfo/Idh/MocA family oxidoreductase [Clostridia bacterium]|nr:Gfo/Idh/MocA family oxidoreductase [Clostridia bacterium]